MLNLPPFMSNSEDSLRERLAALEYHFKRLADLHAERDLLHSSQHERLEQSVSEHTERVERSEVDLYALNQKVLLLEKEMELNRQARDEQAAIMVEFVETMRAFLERDDEIPNSVLLSFLGKVSEIVSVLAPDLH